MAINHSIWSKHRTSLIEMGNMFSWISNCVAIIVVIPHTLYNSILKIKSHEIWWFDSKRNLSSVGPSAIVSHSPPRKNVYHYNFFVFELIVWRYFLWTFIYTPLLLTVLIELLSYLLVPFYQSHNQILNLLELSPRIH